MTFYRLEHRETRQGAYHSAWAISMEYINDKHPAPDKDSLLHQNAIELGYEDAYVFQNGNWRFGFSSMKQLRAWFFSDEWLGKLHEKGLVLSVYDVPTIIIGHSQAVMNEKFHTDKNRVQEISLKNFLTDPTQIC